MKKDMKTSGLIFLILFSGIQELYGQVDSLQEAYLAGEYARLHDPEDSSFNLLVAADLGYQKEVLSLLNAGISANASSPQGITPLMYASQAGSLETVKTLVLNGALLNVEPLNGITALHGAVNNNHKDIVLYLAECGAEVNTRDNHMVSPLMSSVSYGYFGITDILLFYGADTEARDRQGTTPLMLAALSANTAILEMLLLEGADPMARDDTGNTALHCAAQSGDSAAVAMLLDRGAEIDAMNHQGYTPLASATRAGNYRLVQQLLQAGASLNGHNGSLPGFTPPLLVARETKNRQIGKLLKEHGASAGFSPQFKTLRFGLQGDFNIHDMSTGAWLGIEESQHLLAFCSGFSFRPSAVRILVEDREENLFYQYWEQRYYVWVGLEKRIPLFTASERNVALEGLLGSSLCFSWGKYRGSSTRPVARPYLVPEAGFLVGTGRFSLKCSYSYLPLDTYRIMDSRLRIGIIMSQNLVNERKTTKTVYWW